MHPSTEEPATSRMLEPYGEVGGNVPEYFSSRTHFAKIEDKKVIAKIKSKNLQAGVFFNSYHGVPIIRKLNVIKSMFLYR